MEGGDAVVDLEAFGDHMSVGDYHEGWQVGVQVGSGGEEAGADAVVVSRLYAGDGPAAGEAVHVPAVAPVAVVPEDGLEVAVLFHGGESGGADVARFHGHLATLVAEQC